MREYKEVQNYLESFINYEKKAYYSLEKVFKLARVRNLFKNLDILYDNLPIIHLAGTKGKGSSATFLAYLLASGNYCVGLYTSPHLQDFRERIRIIEKRNSFLQSYLIPPQELISLVSKLIPLLEKLRNHPRWGRLTFFEVYTAIALKYFLQKKVDFMVLETGLGGRKDATNVLKPLISLLTPIGYDHTQKLGSTLGEIAYEKAGIIKANTPVVVSFQKEEAMRVIRKRAEKLRAPLYCLGKDFFYSRMKLAKNYTVFDFHFKKEQLKRVKIYLKGEHQVENASLALGGFFVLKEKNCLKGEFNFKEGLKSCFLEGRFEIVRKRPLVILDIAHNISSFSALEKTLKSYFPHKKVILIFSASRDKDVRGMLREISFEKIIFTRFLNNPRAYLPCELKKLTGITQAKLERGIKEAFHTALKLYNSKYLILIAGSLFLVAEAKFLLKKWFK